MNDLSSLYTKWTEKITTTVSEFFVHINCLLDTLGVHPMPYIIVDFYAGTYPN